MHATILAIHYPRCEKLKKKQKSRQMEKMDYDVIVIGGGAAGFFSAINCSEANPHLRIAILEKTNQVLTKVKISGGGRCNVTHACFDERELIKNYPRGNKELLGPFTRFKTSNTIEWFRERGVKLKIEEDGRMFPTTDSSSTIIDCFLKEIERLNVRLFLNANVKKIKRKQDSCLVEVGEKVIETRNVLLSTGSNAKGLELAAGLGHKVVDPVPSLFTFNVPDSPFLDLAGISINPVEVSISETRLKERGPVLLTHWGFSGPAILKLSAWGARILNDRKYETQFSIDWVPDITSENLKETILLLKSKKPNARCSLEEVTFLPKNLAKRFLELLDLEEIRYASLSKKQIEALVTSIKCSHFSLKGKTTYKQEFVTSGGIDLKEVNFKTLESLLIPGLFFAGEILNIDGITGGFNFQNAWTTSWIAAQAIKEKGQK
ncbi:putative protein YtfP [Chlamydiales bacterium STE3]|nr:putative protein YtfP [Chlamydiales bacterium STE3]